MGKVGAAMETTKRKKKKGRPSLLDLQKRAIEQQQQNAQINRRSTRRNPTVDGISDYIDDEDDDDERKEKKVKLVVRLPQSNQFPSNSGSAGSDSNPDGENPEAKGKINAGSGDSLTDQGEKVLKATDTLHGSPLESGPTTPLPDKKLLVFILDRLQKKDTYGVFSEPVDPNELPDYHEIIEHPMDFGTLRTKLDEGLYSNLEELEADVFLICSNAMQYNSSDTIYFRQARSIQELAKRDFENLRQEDDDGELQPKVVKRGRPPSKHLKKPVGRPPLDRVGPESTSGATLATAEDNATESNPYNLRGAPMLYKYHSADGILNSQRSRNGEHYSEWLSDWNDEFPASIRKADMKYGKKQFTVDENRRDTYKQFHPSAFVQEPSLMSNFAGDRKQLMAVGLHVEHGYARSLARFAANLGPVVWKVASKKIERVLPPGLSFGPGRVGENEASPPPPSFFSPENQRNLQRLASDGFPRRPETPSTSGANSSFSNRPSLPCKEVVEDDRRVHSQNESSVPRGGVSRIRPGLSFQTQPNKPQLHPGRNGYNGVFGCNFPSQMGMAGPSLPAEKPGQEEASSMQMLGMVHGSDSNTLQSGKRIATATGNGTCIDSNTIIAEVGHSHYGKPSWQQVPSTNHRQFSLPVPPDLNVGLQGSGSPQQPNSGLRIGSPQQPDLALQL